MIIRKFLDPDAPSLPQQVSENTKDIAELEENIKPWYNTQNMLMESSSTIALSDTNIGTATTGFLLSKNALLFKIVGVEEGVVYISYWASLPRGEQGEQGETGETGNGILNIQKISTSGFVDTYQITFTNGAKYNYNVTNGDSFNFMGDWVEDNEYYKNDVVKYNGNLYILIADSLDMSNTPPNSDLINWSLFLIKGQDGANGSGINENLLLNGDFSINQIKKYVINTNREVGADAWYILKNQDAYIDYNSKLLSCGENGTYCILRQITEIDASLYGGQEFTFSGIIQNDGLHAGFAVLSYYSNGQVIDITRQTLNANFNGQFKVTGIVPDGLPSGSYICCNIFKNAGYMYFNKLKLEQGDLITGFNPVDITEQMPRVMRLLQIYSESFTIPPNVDRRIPMRVEGTTTTIQIDGVNYQQVSAYLF